MAPRGSKRKSRRRRNVFRVLTALESYLYADIITRNVAGTSPWGMLTGDADLQMWSHGPTGTTGYTGAGEISLGDILKDPSTSLGLLAENFQKNLIPMAIQTAMTGFSFRIARRLLRAPLRSINKNLVKPALGPGVAL